MIIDLSIKEIYITYYIISVLFNLSSAIVVSGVDSIFFVILIHLSAHFTSVGEEFSVLGALRDDDDDEELDEWNKNVMPLTEEQEKIEFEKLKRHIDRHNDLINTVNKLEEVSSNISLIHFLYSSFTICLILYQVNAVFILILIRFLLI